MGSYRVFAGAFGGCFAPRCLIDRMTGVGHVFFDSKDSLAGMRIDVKVRSNRNNSILSKIKKARSNGFSPKGTRSVVWIVSGAIFIYLKSPKNILTLPKKKDNRGPNQFVNKKRQSKGLGSQTLINI